MDVECHICFEPLVQDTKVVALGCGHACCSPCLEAWLAANNEKRCPICRHMPSTGPVVPQAIFLKFTYSSSTEPPDSRTTIKLDGAIKSAGALKSLLEGSVSLRGLDGTNIGTILDEAERLNGALKDLFRIRELQGIMTDISAQLCTIRSEIAQQKQLEKHLQLRLAQSTAQNEASKRELEAERADKGILQAKLATEREDNQDVIQTSEQAIAELTITTEKLKNILRQKRNNSLTAETGNVQAAQQSLSQPSFLHIPRTVVPSMPSDEASSSRDTAAGANDSLLTRGPNMLQTIGRISWRDRLQSAQTLATHIDPGPAQVSPTQSPLVESSWQSDQGSPAGFMQEIAVLSDSDNSASPGLQVYIPRFLSPSLSPLREASPVLTDYWPTQVSGRFI